MAPGGTCEVVGRERPVGGRSSDHDVPEASRPLFGDQEPPQDLPHAALRLLERLIDSEKRCERLQGRLQDARERISQLEFQLCDSDRYHATRS